ncbi:alpha/beta fold hydrolase [Candidatus Enterococcus murrayae]|uniref:Alpha/beta hydrolase n=1 Tax=Candidatus Enterococcus murrayae TaxID=2815321 RepID=A0ABS3HG99_9ENTE|nr:alpha/beta hydrolase [Enterococcus sp. MJM16]MBO0452467.1 alpha/beta hydrolase [Enterococcus sp. MJM16]
MSFFSYQGKNIFYETIGEGKPLVFLHGNTSSSKLFTPMLPLYTDFQVVLIDFLGYGRSDRLDKFPTELWKDEARQTIALLEHLALRDVNLVGTSGGAWVAINTAFLRPDLIATVTADSFDGRTFHDGFDRALLAERSTTLADPEASQFYHWCIGEDWKEVVERDTDSMWRLIVSRRELFFDSLQILQAPLLLTATKRDEMIRPNIEREYQAIVGEVVQGQFKLFEKPGHPAIGSSAEEVAETINQFIAEYS